MSNPHEVLNKSQHLRAAKPARGFSLLELMVAMSVFLIVGGAAVSLVRRHMPLFNTSQNQTQMNMALRNAVAQLQMEVVNAGTGFGGSGAVAFSPMGATISKAANPNCRATATYVAGCFDSLSLIQIDGGVPALAPSLDAAGTTPVDTTVNTAFFLTVPGNPGSATAAQYAAWAANLKAGTELILVQGGTDAPTGQPAMGIVVLQNDAVPNASSISITTTGPTQKNYGCKFAPGNSVNGVPVGSTDPLKLYDDGECARFYQIFQPGLDYVVKVVAGAKYEVDASNPANPRLVRTDVNGNKDIIAEQIIGFTVGAWSDNVTAGPLLLTSPVNPASGYTTNPDDFTKDWASVRSVQVQLVVRAAPNSDNPSTFQNAYDQGPYQVQGMSVVINPRNLNTN
jgi:prepilin-type N-terminal cleavage/methylation domain-containing protein